MTVYRASGVTVTIGGVEFADGRPRPADPGTMYEIRNTQGPHIWLESVARYVDGGVRDGWIEAVDLWRTFVIVDATRRVHELRPVADWRSWSSVTLCRRTLWIRGRMTPERVKPGVFTPTTCKACIAEGPRAALAVALARFGEAVGSMVGLAPATSSERRR
jgi:hypothetical protein